MIKEINVRFFVVDYDDEEMQDDFPQLKEVQEAEFIAYQGEISYERHSIWANGCKQICLTKRQSKGLKHETRDD